MRTNFFFGTVRLGRVTTLTFVGLAVVFALLLLGLQPATKPAHAATTFTVNSIGDENDPGFPDASDGKCDVDTGTTGNQCTLRAAIHEANKRVGADLINFNIPGSGLHTIVPSSELPPITDTVTINGYTEAGSSANTLGDPRKGTNAKLMIALDGSSAGNGLDINAPSVVVKGLAIHSFNSRGIVARSSAEHLRIEGNFIGTDPGGIQDKGNGAGGVSIESAADATVGGDTPAARNLISGNNSVGVFAENTNNTEVKGNVIGTQKNGTSPLPNLSTGVEFSNGGVSNSVGGSTVGSANTIAHNGDGGVVVFGGEGVYLQASVLRNSIFSNNGKGISLPLIDNNDTLDTDTGANGGQNSPVISTATTTSRATTIVGTLHSKPGQTYTLMFYSNPPESFDEGKTFKVQKSVTTDGSGNGTFNFKLKRSKKIPVGQFVTATARSFNGDTSEFSAPIPVS